MSKGQGQEQVQSVAFNPRLRNTVAFSDSHGNVKVHANKPDLGRCDLVLNACNDKNGSYFKHFDQLYCDTN